jgi:signal peptidase I
MINFLITIGTIGSWLFTTVFAFSIFVVEGASMEPTLYDSELFFIDGYTYKISKPQREDIVVFSFDEDPDYYYVKRIIGLPGEKIHIKDDGIYIENNAGFQVKLYEDYLKNGLDEKSVYSRMKDRDEVFAIPEDKYFVLGDNREESMDSRSFKQPFVSLEEIEGRLLYTFKETPMLVSEKGAVKFEVEIADDPEDRKLGLMYREYLPEEHGMLFIFEEEQPLSFWMKNTLIPLDMIFFNDGFEVLNIAGNVPPCESDPCLTYNSEGNARYVLEINGGLSDYLGIRKGDKFRLQK